MPLARFPLAGLQGFHLLLDRAEGDEPVNEYRLRLTDAVGAIRRLLLNGGIPPRIVMKTVSAAVRLSPVPPALRLTRNTGT